MSSGISRIGSNIASLTAQRRLAEADYSLSISYERLSSGQRINHASDDAAGLAIAKSLDANARVYRQAIRNLNDGISAANIAEGALGALRDISHRQLELAEQSANGTYSLTQRQAMSAEANKLVEEYNRIVQTTCFNGQFLLEDNQQGVRIQAGNGVDGSLVLGLGQELFRTAGDGTFQIGALLTSTIVQDVKAADFNGDGKTDLVLGMDGLTSVVLGNGNGTFDVPTLVAGSANVVSLLAEDLNHDGKVDLAMTNRDSYGIDIFLGLGDGTFSARVRYTSGGQPFSLSSADFNADGNIDLVSANCGDNTFSVLLGNGDGSFRFRPNISAGSVPEVVSTGDINGDERPDMLIGDAGRILTFFGNGDGSFSGGLTFSAGDVAGAQLADLNMDGKQDLVVTNYVGTSVSVYLGNGNGSFRRATSYSVTRGSFLHDVETADVDGDGYLDLVTANPGTTSVSILLGKGDGTFNSARYYTLSAAPFGMAVADVTGDGALEILTSTVLSPNVRRIGSTPFINLSSRQGALQAFGVINGNLQRIENELGSIGAATSRFGVALNTLAATRENITAASSRITDADIGQEAAQLTRTQIVQQAAASVLAQANQQPQIALNMLRSV